MSTVRLFAAGQELHIGKRLGKGGEGEVFSIVNMPGFAVKTYLPGVVGEREKKIRAMVGARLADSASMVAFPYQIAVDGSGSFVGFVMRLVEGCKEIHELQTPSSRIKHFPKADYAFIVRVALNVARVFAQVHSAGCVIGDINQRGILVSPTATVALIDADSFQVNDGTQCYLCVVGVPEYTPPELQGRSLKTIVRTTDHDAFGLAVCLFQLLCMDRHPFSGRFTGQGEMTLEKAITDYRFAYSSRRTDMVPPPGSVRLDDFPSKIALLFEAAFSPQNLGKRPSARAWVEALEGLEAELRVCSHNKLHRYPRSAKECPWCRMEGEYGRPLFLYADLTNIYVPNGRLDPVAGLVLDIPSILAALNSVPIPSSISVTIPLVAGATLAPSQLAKDAIFKKTLTSISRVGGFIILGAVCILLLAQVPGIVSFGMAALGCWLLFRSHSPEDEVLEEYKKATGAISLQIERLQRTSPIEKVLRKKAEALDAIDDFKNLALAFGNVRNEYEKHRWQMQLENHLSQFTIRGAGIPKVRSSDIAQLASYGFTTALDAKRRDVRKVHGIGPVKASKIAEWIRSVEAEFRFQSTYTPDDQRNIQKAQNEIIGKQQGLEDRLKKLVAEFRQESLGFEKWRLSRDPELVRLAQQLAQAEVDLLHLGVSVPFRPNVAPLAVPPISNFQRRGNNAPPAILSSGQSHAATCPLCGSKMTIRTARRGRHTGRPFWGCSRYPVCCGTRPI